MNAFHFLRPWWLLAFIPCALLVWLIQRRQDSTRPWRGIVAPHLLPFLLSGQTQRSRFSPLLLIGIGWIISVIAIAGPTWRREPAPFADDTAALAIVVKVTPSMLTEDVQPNRLARGVEKIRDLLALRPGAKTSLIAYAGSAHVVMPTTTDDGIINTFAQALTPKIMPNDGEVAADALRLADETLKDSGSGSILWITDSIAPEQLASLTSWRNKARTPVRLLPTLLEGEELKGLRDRARAVEAHIVPLSPDDTDVNGLARAATFSTTPSAGALSERWEESGYWLTPLLALVLVMFFRKGWMTAAAATG